MAIIRFQVQGKKPRNPYVVAARVRSGAGRHQDIRKAAGRSACRGWRWEDDEDYEEWACPNCGSDCAGECSSNHQDRRHY